jgi:hypothetical protein
MKKWILTFALLLIAMLAGCSSSPDYKVDITKPLYFQQDKESSFEIKVTENKKAVTGLKVSLELSMANMDHGNTKVDLKEEQKGLYTGNVELPMDGKYEMAFTLKKGNKKTEEVFDYEVKKPEGVASVNGEWIKNEDLEFYELINRIQFAINRETAQKKYSGKQLEDELAYLDSQEKTLDDKNQLLTQIIRLRSMAMLSEEKGHKASTEEVNAALTKAKEQYDQFESAKQLIQQYGEEKFWSIEKQQYKMIVLTQQIQKDVIAQVKKENPNVGEQEINFQAQKKYEDLLVEQINSLKIEIL